MFRPLGIEGRKIFRNNKDRQDFIDRLQYLCPSTQTKCYTWALMSNHAHFLFRTGTVPLSRLMRRLLTGYVVGFNYRHSRRGQLFQNRFKSVICQLELYLRELVRVGVKWRCWKTVYLNVPDFIWTPLYTILGKVIGESVYDYFNLAVTLCVI
jgi:hypothetical protein